MLISTEPISLENLPAEIRDEILDTNPKYANRQHYSRATSALGCHGPLCRKAERDRRNQRYRERCKEKGKTVRPYNLGEERQREEEYLSRVVVWYLMWRRGQKILQEETA